jgi:hypothetical protein
MDDCAWRARGGMAEYISFYTQASDRAPGRRARALCLSGAAYVDGVQSQNISLGMSARSIKNLLTLLLMRKHSGSCMHMHFN